jgi:hypothetical protein
MSVMLRIPRPFFESTGQKSSVSFEETLCFKFGVSQSEVRDVFFRGERGPNRRSQRAILLAN